MDCSTRRHLVVLDDACRQGPNSHLIVSVHFRNFREKPYLATVRVSFFDKEGQAEERSGVAEQRSFEPGELKVEWTSYTAQAERYLVEIKSARRFQW
ncbi:MAG: hypothetical protein J7M08_06605 [Planctomycetes bacterium]|nr:hypothetical protein [Planctomycetota bacterium]